VGPITLFDKSFLQSLTVDESVWFGHFFSPVVCPLFYVETLADLEKEVRKGRTPEQEVRIIAAKFPDQSANPCAFHGSMLINDLLGWHVPLDGRVPLPGGKAVAKGDRRGFVFDETPEMAAFSRWQQEKFLEIERLIARGWRESLKAVDLSAMIPLVQKLGVDSRSCRSLDSARDLARRVVGTTSNPFVVAALIHMFLELPRQASAQFLERWQIATYPPLPKYAPYAAHVLSVELFFQFALAARLVGAERSSNRVDMAYLNYVPFCMAFVSSDRLHSRTAPYFLRDNQTFVWGPDLKQDLARLNSHFLTLPETERDKGIMTFAHAPPKVEGSLVRELRARFLGSTYDDRPRIEPAPEGDPRDKQLVADIDDWEHAPEVAQLMGDDGSEADMMMIKRRVAKRKGSWWQLPKDLTAKD
jgi:hypothetical protein